MHTKKKPRKLRCGAKPSPCQEMAETKQYYHAELQPAIALGLTGQEKLISPIFGSFVERIAI